jgi:dTDP-4-dehydrorhamnose reductase
VTSVLVLGARGLLGSACTLRLRRDGFDVTSAARSDFDPLSDPLDRLDWGRFDYVINAIGLVNRRLATAGEVEFTKINARFPHALAEACRQAGTRLVHISTDCVFDGDRGLYLETDPPNAEDLYGRSKRDGEPAEAMVVRTSIIGPERRNLYSLLCWFLSSTEPCEGYLNHLWNGVTALELARVLGRLMRGDAWRTGLLHIHGEDVTKDALLRIIAAAYRHPRPIAAREVPEGRDMRLRSQHGDLLAYLGVRPLAQQVADIAALSDGTGRWLDLPEFGSEPRRS